MSKYYSNRKTRLEIGSAGENPTFTEIPRLRNIPGFSFEEDLIEVTHNGSSQREYIPSDLADTGDWEFEMETDRTDPTHQLLFQMRTTKEVRKFRETYPDGLAYEFPATVKSITRAEVDTQKPDVILDTVALAICGDVEDISDSLLS